MAIYKYVEFVASGLRDLNQFFQLTSLTDSLAPTLVSLRQLPFYTNPRFHASVAWMLVDPPPDEGLSVDTYTRPLNSIAVVINSNHQAYLSRKSVGSFEVKEIKVKIGKEITSWPLSG